MTNTSQNYSIAHFFPVKKILISGFKKYNYD